MTEGAHRDAAQRALLAARPSARQLDLQDEPVENLRGVGPQTAAVLRARGFGSVGDLLALTPRRYLDLREADDWRRVRHGAEGTLIAVEGRVEEARLAGAPRARRLLVALREPRGTTVLRAVFFHVRGGVGARFAVGATVRLVGALRQGPNGPELVHPKVAPADARVKPIEARYPAVGSVGAGVVARAVAAAMERAREWADPVPAHDAARLRLMSSAEALRRIHQPGEGIDVAALRDLAAGRSEAHRRLGLEELLAVSVAVERARRAAGGARSFEAPGDPLGDVAAKLRIDPTTSQRGAVDALVTELRGRTPMRRLLVGDVGAGKTAVALAASLAVLRGGGAVAWLCPTTLVAEQHVRSLTTALGGEGGPVALLLGSTAPRARREAHRRIAEGAVRVVVGTHALLDSGALPPALGLAVIDEQQRFGVAQRLAVVSGRSPSPHLLVMSATPIPRSLAQARYGDLDLLMMEGRPAGRQPVVTRVAPPRDRAFVERTMARALESRSGDEPGRVFVVVPRIDEADDLEEADGARDGGSSIVDAQRWLRERFGEDHVSVLHGRMSADAQREAMGSFRRGDRRILLGTSVVEVGIDVPQANLMVILGADRFGVAQLHQLRGRVGRGGQRAGCVLVPDGEDDESRARLDEVAGCDDGFALAERDLSRRGAGEWFGVAQSGADSTMRFGDPIADPRGASEARAIAARVVASDPDLREHGALARAVQRLLARGAEPVAEDAG
ncbi:MAG: helicase-related protein [Polyangiales bacterium]